LRVGLVSTLCSPVRRVGSDSVEGLVWLLSRELTRLGHEVTVFAAAGSEPCGELVATLPGPPGTPGVPDDWQVCEWINLCRAVEQSARFDVLHSHSYLHGLPLQALSQAPLIHTLHVTPYRGEAVYRSLFPEAVVTGVSHSQWGAHPGLEPAATIHHGVDVAEFAFRAEPADYVCYLGRFTAGKGPLQAVAVARELGVRLLLAGPADEYFRRHVAPLVDGRRVEYVGFVSGERRSQLLGGARALLYPIQDPEPFGLVQVEAMLCGTPVAATRRGAVPEVVDEGVTGYSVERPEDFAPAVVRAFALDRRAVRARAERRFSAERMAREYSELYRRVAAAGAKGRN
jgi:glycosyltransferase involved in cell wall biosynthesis